MRTMTLAMSMAFLAACGGESIVPAKSSQAPVSPELLPVSAVLAGEFGLRDGSEVTGKVTWKGAALKPKKLKMGADPYCEGANAAPMSEDAVVSEAGDVQWAFLYVSNPPAGKFEAPKEAVVIDQVGCVYKPHVFGIMAGQPLKIKNSDDTNHNIHAMGAINPEFNKSQPKKGMENDEKFGSPEIGLKIKCDVHPWMSAWANVMTHPFFAVSGADGAFKITGLPAGKYKVAIWHESLEGTKEVEIEVDGKGPKAGVTFELNAKKEKK